MLSAVTLLVMPARVTAQQPPQRVIAIAIAGRRAEGAEVQRSGRGAGVVRVGQGESIEIVWTSDEPTTLHLHGYNVETRVEAGGKATMRFLARAAGRFPIETHGIGADKRRHLTLVYVEVHPRG